MKLGMFALSLNMLSAASLQAADAKIIRGSYVHFLDDPSQGSSPEKAYEYQEDGALLIENGVIRTRGKAEEVIKAAGPKVAVTKVKGLIVPGFIDTHVHYPQTEMIAAYGEELLKWLEKYTFPTEKQFKNKAYASSVAKVFLQELLRAGTTTALVFSTVHKESVDALMEAAEARNMRLISGKVLMDRNAPEYLRDTPETAYTDSKELIQRWHKKGRLLYAVTPRFAPTSSPEELRSAQKLLGECPDCYMHTHVAENKGEVAWVKELFEKEVPAGTSYLGVYENYGLLTNRAVLAHGVHLDQNDFDLLKKRGSAVAFCPTSNLFLGSGLFPYAQAKSTGVKVGLGTDIGAGTSFSQLQSLNEAYKVIKLQGGRLPGVEAFYLATLGSAKALGLEEKIGNFLPGKEADFVVLNTEATPLLKYRMAKVTSLEETLFVMMTLGDDRAIAASYLAGKKQGI